MIQFVIKGQNIKMQRRLPTPMVFSAQRFMSFMDLDKVDLATASLLDWKAAAEELIVEGKLPDMDWGDDSEFLYNWYDKVEDFLAKQLNSARPSVRQKQKESTLVAQQP